MLLLGRCGVAVDPASHRVTLQDGDSIRYRRLVWATGGSPRRLGCVGHDLTGVHVVRTRTDVDAIVQAVESVERVVVVGGGYIGLETAAALTKYGHKVTVVEALDRVLARVAGEPLSRFYEAEHRAHGVDVRLNAQVDHIVGVDGQVTGVALSDGTILPADMVIVGIGIIPSVDPLLVAGAAGGNGVAVDGHCRTSLPDIHAIGDCALHENRFADGAWIRLESVQNANDQAAVAASDIVGASDGYQAIPWFWSNQFDLKLQTVGLSIGHDDHVVRGNVAARSFSVIYLRGGRVVALDCVNAAKDYVQGRALVLAAITADPLVLADTARTLKDIAAGS